MYLRTFFLSLILSIVPMLGIAQKYPGPGASSQTQERHEWSGHGMFFGGMGSPAAVDRSLNVLQRDLKLTDSQLSQIRQLVESRRGRMETARQQMKPKFDELTRLLSGPSPDPTAVGNAAIAFKRAHEQVKTEQTNIEKEFMNVLNDSQRQTVNRLRAAMPDVMALHRLGLLRGPEGNGEQQAYLMQNIQNR
jgi:Spy/CpxP family protein refolding chaperone